ELYDRMPAYPPTPAIRPRAAPATFSRRTPSFNNPFTTDTQFPAVAPTYSSSPFSTPAKPPPHPSLPSPPSPPAPPTPTPHPPPAHAPTANNPPPIRNAPSNIPPK